MDAACAQGQKGPQHPWQALRHSFATVPSTMAVVRDLAVAGAPEGTHALAARQTQGRGRQGRIWQGEHAGVYMTLLLRPAAHVPLAGLPLVFGLAAYDAVVACLRALGGDCVAPASLGLKWPNDLYAAGRKLGGILVEAEGLATAHPWLLVGLGLNVATTASFSLAPPLKGRYIGLMDLVGPHAAAGRPICAGVAPHAAVEALAQQTLSACYAAYRTWQQLGLAPTVRRWAQLDVLHGRTVRACGRHGALLGTADGIGNCGRLRLKTPQASIFVDSGEVFAIDPPHTAAAHAASATDAATRAETNVP